MFGRFAIWHRRAVAVSRPGEGFSCYTLSASAGGWVAAETDPVSVNLAVRLDQGAPEFGRLLLCIPDADRRFGCLMSYGAEPIVIEGMLPAGIALPVRLDRGQGSDPIGVVHTFGRGRRLTLRVESGTFAFVQGASGPRTHFQLAPVRTANLSKPALRLADEITSAVQLPNSWETILGGLRNGMLRPALAEPVLCSLPIDGLEALSHRLVTCPEDLQRLRAAMPTDTWLTLRMDALMNWQAQRDVAQTKKVCVKLADASDLPGAAPGMAHIPRLGLALHALARRSTQPRRMACILASARNEGPFLLDWIAYHRSIGFDHIFLYTNDTTDGSDPLLDILARAGIVTWLQNEAGPQGRPQIQAYAHGLSVLPDTLDYRWTLVSDLDEYFGFDTKRFSSAQDYLAWQDMDRAEAIALPWLLHVAGPGDIWEDKPCHERFILREETVNLHIKTMFRTNLFWNANPHHPNATLGFPTNFRMENGAPHIPKAPENTPALARDPRASHAWIARYIFKSASDALMKIVRGKGDKILVERKADLQRMLKIFVQLSQKSRLVEDHRTLACAGNFATELARLRGLSGVAACEAAIKETYIAQMDSACLKFLHTPPARDEPDFHTKFRTILTQQRRNQLLSGGAATGELDYIQLTAPLAG